MIEHSDELAARAEHQTDEIAIARLEGQVQGWREAATRLRTRRDQVAGQDAPFGGRHPNPTDIGRDLRP